MKNVSFDFTDVLHYNIINILKGVRKMNINEITERLNFLLENSMLSDAENLLSESIETADRSGDIESLKYLLNEQTGFFRDCGRYKESLKSAETVRKIFELRGETDTVSYATTMLNCANAYRASGEYAKAFDAYETVRILYESLLDPSDSRIASYYNNIALLYQQTENWKQACISLEKALDIVRKSNDLTKTAISCSNLAVSLLKLDNLEQAEVLLNEADSILRGLTPSDFHYSAVLAGFGDLFYKKQDYQKSADFYEQTLSEIELHMGTKGFYEVVSENLSQAYRMSGHERPVLSGIQLSEKYYRTFFEPVLERNFSDVLPQLCIGLAGAGSECFGYDDEFSRDHDFGARFCIFVPSDFPKEKADEIQSAYNALPKTFMGVTQYCTSHAEKRSGIVKISWSVPKSTEEWLAFPDSELAEICNGKIFDDHKGEFTEIRRKLSERPEIARKIKLSAELEIMAQCGQYNYPRMCRRKDFATARIYLSDFCKSAMRTAHLCRKKYAPYEKWLLKSTEELCGFSELADNIKDILTLPTEIPFSQETDPVYSKIKKICSIITAEILGDDFMNKDIYLADVAELIKSDVRKEELADKITLLEWESFDKVCGLDGRAECQDDWETFSIMRKSQYMTWTSELLKQWIAEFALAVSQGRNLITEKYARMMQSTDPEKYADMQDKLPVLSEDFIKVREAVVGIQVYWIEKFSESYPALADRARTIHTSEDSIYQTSYETYLRGELSTYSFELLIAYSQWITGMYRKGENLALKIMENTVKAYGYSSLEDVK